MSNNITKTEMVDIITSIAVEYPKDIDLDNKKTMYAKVNLWHESLKNYDFEYVKLATKKALEQNHFCPKLADIVKIIKEFEQSQELSQEELWSEFSLAVQRASLKTSYFAFTARDENGLTQGEKAKKDCETLYNNLNKVLKEYCGNFQGFMTYAYWDNLDDKLSYEKGRFLKRVDEIKKRLNIQGELTDKMKDLLTFNFKKIGIELDYDKNGDN